MRAAAGHATQESQRVEGGSKMRARRLLNPVTEGVGTGVLTSVGS